MSMVLAVVAALLAALRRKAGVEPELAAPRHQAVLLQKTKVAAEEDAADLAQAAAAVRASSSSAMWSRFSRA